MTQTPKNPKKPLDYAMRQMHDAMEIVFDYDHDPNFVPNGDQLLLFEMLHKQIAGYAAMSFIIIQTMRERARGLASISHPTPNPSPRGGGEQFILVIIRGLDPRIFSHEMAGLILDQVRRLKVRP